MKNTIKQISIGGFKILVDIILLGLFRPLKVAADYINYYLAAFMHLLRRLTYRHSWVYRNPYDKRCRVCKRHEVMHYTHNRIGAKVTFWDVFDDGDVTKHTHTGKQNDTI